MRSMQSMVIINRIIKALTTLAAFIVLAIRAYGVMAADYIVDAITMVLIPRLEYGLAACHAEFEVIIII